MAMIDVSATETWTLALAPFAGWPEAAVPARPVGRLNDLATRFLTWRAQRATLRALRAVDAATLRDLGISDIESAVYGDPRDRMRGYDANWWRAKR